MNIQRPITATQRIEFLLSKGVMKDNPIRDISFDLLNNPASAPTNKFQQLYKSCQERLDRVLSKAGDMTSDTIPEDVQTFDLFCVKHPEWTDESKSFVFHRDHPTVSQKQVVLQQRAQLSGLCYIHGPDMLQHYLVSMNKDTLAGMIDISKLIRETFSAEELESHIFRNEGGDSAMLLRRILQPGSIIFASRSELFDRDLQEFGCGLVSKFTVFADFDDRTAHSHQGKPEGEELGLHCLVLIGVRVDAEGKRWFLLQNWWKQKQFVEVKEDYFKACAPTIYFVETPQFDIPEKFPKNYARYAENENYLDKSESYGLGEMTQTMK
jgi:hypothetical protein